MAPAGTRLGITWSQGSSGRILHLQFWIPVGQVQAINSSRMSQELNKPLVLEGFNVQGGGHSGKPLGSFSELLCPMLGLFCPPWLRFLGSSLEPGAQGGRIPALGWGETPVLLPAKLYPEISSRQPGFSGVLSQNGV